MTETTESMTGATATLGQRLKAEREKKGLSTQKAADELHLDGWVIDALEGGDYARIGPAVYAKGHLKRYAALLGLPTAEILDAYDTQSKPPAPGQTTGLRLGTASSTGSEAPWAQMLGFAVVAVVVAGVVWWKPWQLWMTNTTRAALPAKTAAAVPSGASEPADGAGAERARAEDVSGEDAGARNEDAAPAGVAAPAGGVPVGVAAIPAPATVRPAAAISSSPPATAGAARADATRADATRADGTRADAGRADAARAGAAGAGRARLRLSFSADAWVDVHDATGQRLYAGNGRANSTKTVSGEAPLRVYLKSAGGVQLQINDRAVAIGRQFVSGDAARFEAGADGVLRRESRPAGVPPNG
jgi:cytoskeleton protein RodZ